MTVTGQVLDLAPPQPAAGHAAVLVVEDDDAVGVQLVRGLVRAGYTATRVATGAAALAALEGPTPPEVVLLDLGLPDLDGTEVCRRVRAHGDIPVIVVTARGDESDRVEVLDLGGDDYLVKPFGFAELLARIRAVRRRFARAEALADAARAARATGFVAVLAAADATPAPGTGEPGGTGGRGNEGGLDPDVIRHGALVVDRRTRRITLAGRPVAATAREFDLLAYLAADPGRVRARREIFQAIWGPWFGSTKVLDVHIGSLRRKLGRPELIETVYGVGFRLADPAEPAG
ncbi:response regulator transcription factor [Pseudofrankia sp. DC12]|uniref:response regulator transcription factor n=1 Tax=Pseudofrankia sp. DC12 TaxID=683315 RepID=UPI000A018454|nr:response regulator transcription factor [Pseudofrankia sp. DC12]